MVSAATRKMRRSGIHRNNGRISAIFLAKKVSSQKKEKRQDRRKTPINIAAIGDPK
jgi:hypothetical protein